MSGWRRSNTLGVLLLLLSAVFALQSRAEVPSADLGAKQVWQLLDYIALDYRGAVARGVVIDVSEYEEMQEFAATTEQQLRELPAGGTGGNLRRRATWLRKAIADKADPDIVARIARDLARDLQAAYRLSLAPTQAPDLKRGAQLYRAQCSACHGATGQGDATSEATSIVLIDPERARERSLFALYQVISTGVAGTGMPGYGAMPEADLWALAFFVGTLTYADADRVAGEARWQARASAREAVASLEQLTQLSERALAERIGQTAAHELNAYLRSNPHVIETNKVLRLYMAKSCLAESVAAVRRHDQQAATRFALSAYLDGYELVEAALGLRDHALYERIESDMAAFRVNVARGDIEGAQALEAGLRNLLDEAERTLVEADSPTAMFSGTLANVLRGGLGAMLVVVAASVFARSTEGKRTRVHAHAGWIVALVAGSLSWLVLIQLQLSGRSRELVEGLSSSISAVALLAASIWLYRVGSAMHLAKSQDVAAPRKHRAWFVFALVFLTAYGALLETVLFCLPFAAESPAWPLLAGVAAGFTLLGLMAAVVVRASTKFPTARSLSLAALLIVLLAAILTGTSTAELQEAGVLPTDPIAIPRVDDLGIYPSWQAVIAQATTLLAFLVTCVVKVRPAPSTTSESH